MVKPVKSAEVTKENIFHTILTYKSLICQKQIQFLPSFNKFVFIASSHINESLLFFHQVRLVLGICQMVRGPLPVRDCPRRTVATRVTTNTWPTPNSRKSPVAGKESGLCPQSFCARVTHFKLVG